MSARGRTAVTAPTMHRVPTPGARANQLRPRPLQVREENPRLARDSKVLRVTMDNVYEVFTTPRDQTGLQVCVCVCVERWVALCVWCMRACACVRRLLGGWVTWGLCLHHGV
jgi:hypothetical protein